MFAVSTLWAKPEELQSFLENHCLDCHDSETQKGELNLESLSFRLGQTEKFDKWLLVHDKVQAGEMPPKKKRRPKPEELAAFLNPLSTALGQADRKRVAKSGRATVRRLNRFEFENSLRERLRSPWLLVADMLPEDGTAHLFNKVGERLDVSHVQISKFYEVAEYALRAALETVAHKSNTQKFYAREEGHMKSALRWKPNIQTAATRASIPLLGTTPQPEIIRGNQPMTVGPSNPEVREQEAVGFVSGTYTATTKYDFTRVRVPIDGRYKIRMKTYTFLAGPNGASGGNDHGLTGGNKAWWRPSRTVAFPGTRSEPITLYSVSRNGDSRWLGVYDSYIEPSVSECEVILKKNEIIRPDATRLIRTRPGWTGNANATREGVPGFALNWLEIEGPLQDEWPPASFKAVAGDLPYKLEGGVKLVPEDTKHDARKLLLDFMKRMYRRPVDDAKANAYLAIFERSRELGRDFTDSIIAACATILCSSDYLYLDAEPGPLGQRQLASRLSFFLWNSPPDEALVQAKRLGTPKTLHAQTERLLDNPRAKRFVNSFLDYWLDLRDILANAPDATLYPDYYLDDELTEASVFETRAFFTELIAKDLPARNVVDSNFIFANERLAKLYGLEPFEGIKLRKVSLPKDSPRGGLMTQASVLRVTANGTTTSPVVRGAWVMERIMGLHIPPPPSGVEAITPDTRGTTTIREQLDKHREIESCATCHRKFDPVGFALESFDVAGGWRERYRSLGKEGDRVKGFGKNGHAFKFRLAKAINCTGKLEDNSSFSDITELKRLLLADERAIARNLVHRFIVYATSAPVSFGDRETVETILDQCAGSDYGVRSLIHAVIQSELFLNK
ncbi:MAG: DUF1592 domain-containing protein [Verrucomicrobiota bacterium]|nr:DUF1592 domain-containing protein [Verrucomicrobiota bacterium]